MHLCWRQSILEGKKMTSTQDSNPGTHGSQLLNVTTTVFSSVVLSDVSLIVLKHPYWAVRLTKICDNSPSDYLPSISRLVTHATRLTLNSIIPNILEIKLVH